MFSIRADQDRLGNAEPYRAIFPKYDGPVLHLDGDGNRTLSAMHWGFVLPQKSKKTGNPIQPKAVNNARDDKVLTSGFWKRHFEHRRCLIPATAFCEAKGRNPATYFWFGADNRAPFCLAGLWSHYDGPYGKEQKSLATYSMLTTTPNAIVQPIHPDRMPVILDEGDWDTWLNADPQTAAGLMTPFSEDRMSVIDSGKDLRSEPE